VALFLTTVVAKVLASYFQKQTFFDQMAETLRNVRACSSLHMAVCTSQTWDVRLSHWNRGLINTIAVPNLYLA